MLAGESWSYRIRLLAENREARAMRTFKQILWRKTYRLGIPLLILDFTGSLVINSLYDHPFPRRQALIISGVGWMITCTVLTVWVAWREWRRSRVS